MANDASQNLRTYLLTSTTLKAFVADRIYQSRIPMKPRGDYLWLRQGGKLFEHTFDDAVGTGPRAITFDLECCSQHPDRAADISDAVRGLFPYAGTMGDATVKGAFVNDQDEDYLPINEVATEGIHVQALRVEVCP